VITGLQAVGTNVAYTPQTPGQGTIAPSNASVSEDGTLVFSAADNNAIALIDTNAAASTEQLNLTANNGVLTLATTSGLTFIGDSSNGSATMTIEGTLAALNNALAGVTYAPTPGYSGTTAVNANYQDLGNSQTTAATVNVTVNPFNPPAWLSFTSAVTWNASTHTLAVIGNASITADPSTYGVTPIIAAGNGSQMVLDTPLVHIGGLSLQSGATLDIASNTLFINYGNGSSPLATVQADVQNGTILSSTANAGNPGQYTVGYADSTELTSIASGNVEVLYTLAGDANLDGRVNFNDFSILQNNYDQSGRDWSQGDYNHDGLVNFNDFSILQNNYDQSLTGASSIFSSAAINSAAPKAAAAPMASSNAAPVYATYTPATENLFSSDANSILA